MTKVDLKKIKMMLEVNLIEDSKVEIKLPLIRNEFLNIEPYKAINYTFYRDSINDMIIFSDYKFRFDDKQFRLPDIKNIDKDLKFTYDYYTEANRKRCLCNLFNSLNNWAMIKSSVSSKKKNNIVLDDNKWYIL